MIGLVCLDPVIREIVSSAWFCCLASLACCWGCSFSLSEPWLLIYSLELSAAVLLGVGLLSLILCGFVNVSSSF